MGTEQTYETKRIDHLGIAAGICHEIGLIEAIDQAVASTERKVSCGQVVLAMVLNGLGFTSRALYLMPQYLDNKPVDLLIAPDLAAEDFGDDSLGRSLDQLFESGVTEVFAQVAQQALQTYGLEHRFFHLDSSSFHLHGQYSAEEPEIETIEITYGFSKEQRPDLKQVVLGLITGHCSQLPIWMEVLSGNHSDKDSFPDSIQAFCKQLKAGKDCFMVADSALYGAENLGSLGEIRWLTRVPETLAGAKRLVVETETDEMTELPDGYAYLKVPSDYGGVAQRWLVVHSPVTALAEVQKKWKYHQAEAEALALTGYRLEGQVTRSEEALEKVRRSLGRFILATNELDPEQLSAEAKLSQYRAQAVSVERGFRFLKDPLSFADSLFLKNPGRIMALIMIMVLALLVYALAESKLRLRLTETGETVLNQVGKPTQTPTMRWIFQVFEDLDLLVIRQNKQIVTRQVLNLRPEHLTVIRLLGPPVEKCYILGFKVRNVG